ncbi:MAG: PEGA domain-containing protein, partial [Butyrivibrio sp.]|nr:PEGA domain-containing protein [Butyrivibrio sp.]
MKRLLSFFLITAMLISSPQSITRAAENKGSVTVSLIGKYDSADTAAIREIDLEKKFIRFRNHQTGKTYTLSYDNTSMIYDARGTALSASLLEVGQIVDVTFLKSSKHVTTLNVSKDAWTVEDTRDHELVRGDGTANVKGEIYKIDGRTLVMADEEIALAEDILATDTVTVSGIGKDIYSVVVTGGHGYVSLSSDTVEDHSLVGAWLELDNEVIYKISPNMLLSAPEGDYNLQILGNGANFQSEVSIERNQETVVDTSSVDIEKPKEGLVTFEVIPENAEIFVDGERMLTGTTESLRYGFHNLKVMADGYITQTKYLKIGTPRSVISLELEKEEESAEEASSDSSGTDTGASSTSSSYDIFTDNVNSITSASSASTSASTASSGTDVSGNSATRASKNKVIEGYKIYFDKPNGAELYFDGAYIGVVPVSVTKISGTHEVILKKDGYETKSYRISIDSDEDDLNYTFPSLVKEDDDDDNDDD